MAAKRNANFYLDSEAKIKKSLFDEDIESDEMDDSAQEEVDVQEVEVVTQVPAAKTSRKIIKALPPSEESADQPPTQHQPEPFEMNNVDLGDDLDPEETMEPTKSVTDLLNLGGNIIETVKDLQILKLSDRAALHVSKRLVNFFFTLFIFTVKSFQKISFNNGRRALFLFLFEKRTGRGHHEQVVQEEKQGNR